MEPHPIRFVVLAEKVSVAASTAERWHAALGGDRAVYVWLLAEDDDGHGDERCEAS
jgi:hypothetical protein